MSLFISSQVNYEYADGNNNLYSISESIIKYKPVTKEESSSGVYSGGKPKEKEISSEQYKKLEKLFNEAFSAKKEQQKDREKQCALLIHYVSKVINRNVVLKPNSACKQKIESALLDVMK